MILASTGVDIGEADWALLVLDGRFVDQNGCTIPSILFHALLSFQRCEPAEDGREKWGLRRHKEGRQNDA